MQYSSEERALYLFFAANPKKPATFDARKRMMDAAANCGFLCAELEERAPAPGEEGIIVVIGGDGSIIRQVPAALAARMPILGVHFGRVGFLTELTEEGFVAALPRLKAGDYRLEYRAMLDCQVSTGRVYHCLNDAVLYKLSFSGVTDIDVRIDGKSAWTVSADGVVVSTPTGSTGYSLSAGGPIVPEGVDAMVITPICPHKLHVRPMVVRSDAEVELVEHDDGMAAVDGQRVCRVSKGESLRITGSSERVSFIRLDEMDLYSRIQDRLT